MLSSSASTIRLFPAGVPDLTVLSSAPIEPPHPESTLVLGYNSGLPGMLDDRNRELAEVASADDFIVSDKLIRLLLAQISENAKVAHVFEDLFAAAGSELHLDPAELYVVPGAEPDFYSVLEAALRRGETALGYRVAALARDASHAYGVRLNPLKTDRIAFAPGDKVIVLAEG